MGIAGPDREIPAAEAWIYVRAKLAMLLLLLLLLLL